MAVIVYCRTGTSLHRGKMFIVPFLRRFCSLWSWPGGKVEKKNLHLSSGLNLINWVILFIISSTYWASHANIYNTSNLWSVITLDNKFQTIFVSVMNMLLIYLFASMKLENGHKKDYLFIIFQLIALIWYLFINNTLKHLYCLNF
jgi:hypothetical protein